MIAGFDQKDRISYFFGFLSKENVFSFDVLMVRHQRTYQYVSKWRQATWQLTTLWVLGLENLARWMESATSLISWQRKMFWVLMYSLSDIRELTKMCQSEGKPLDSWPVFAVVWLQDLARWMESPTSLDFGQKKMWVLMYSLSEVKELTKICKYRSSHLTVDHILVSCTNLVTMCLFWGFFCCSAAGSNKVMLSLWLPFNEWNIV